MQLHSGIILYIILVTENTKSVLNNYFYNIKIFLYIIHFIGSLIFCVNN